MNKHFLDLQAPAMSSALRYQVSTEPVPRCKGEARTVVFVIQSFTTGEHWFLQPDIFVANVEQTDLEPVTADEGYQLIGVGGNWLLVQ